MQSSKNWMFTINNPSEGEYPELKSTMQYLIYQKEKGLEGTEHLQGYVVLRAKSRLAAVSKLFPRAHLEVRKGSHEQARDYCSKEASRIGGAPMSFGEEPAQGKRSDLLLIKRKLDEGQSVLDCAKEEELFPSCIRYWCNLSKYQLGVAKQRDFITHTTVVYGESGTGKSTWVRAHAPGAYWVNKPGGDHKTWWDGYTGQLDVVIDEFKGWISRDDFCRLADSTPYQVPTKGGFVNFVAKRIWITSNWHPCQWWDKFEEPLQRRLSGQHGIILAKELPVESDPKQPMSSFVPFSVFQ